MAQVSQVSTRRTSVDDIFDHLHGQILSLQLRPGDKISEADIAAKFGVSRQPVRDAFNRLSNLDLLLIRPQRATEVKRFSLREIVKSRFVRAAIEKEVVRCAAMNCDADGVKILEAALDAQQQAIDSGNVEQFGALDYDFHKYLCQIGKVDFAFDVIMAEKSKVDRLCLLSLSKRNQMPQLLSDHRSISEAIINNDPDRAMEAGMIHLSRLDDTIEEITASNVNYFESSDL